MLKRQVDMLERQLNQSILRENQSLERETFYQEQIEAMQRLLEAPKPPKMEDTAPIASPQETVEVPIPEQSMAHFNELYLILNKYLKWNKSHVKCFTLIMLALIVKQTCNLSSASKALPIKCLPQSFYRRIQRFFAGQYFDYRQISQLIFNIFLFDKVQLTLDRTNWKWGKRDINILMLLFFVLNRY